MGLAPVVTAVVNVGDARETEHAGNEEPLCRR